jgi:hypothetical protein
MTPAQPSSRSGRARRPVLAAALAVLTVLGVARPGLVEATDAGYVSAEQAALTAAAGTVGTAVTVCTPGSGAPHQLTLAPADDGLTVTGYRVHITVDPVPSGSYAWQTGVKDGIELLPIGDSSWPATQTLVGWGIELPLLSGDDFYGTVSVSAIGPGGWESAAVTYDWAIETDWGFATSTCTLATS